MSDLEGAAADEWNSIFGPPAHGFSSAETEGAQTEGAETDVDLETDSEETVPISAPEETVIETVPITAPEETVPYDPFEYETEYDGDASDVELGGGASGPCIVVKISLAHKSMLDKQLEQEAIIMKALLKVKSSNLVKFLGYTNVGSGALAMEYAEPPKLYLNGQKVSIGKNGDTIGTLSSLFKNSMVKDTALVKSIIFQVLATLAVCQKKLPGFKHNDLHLENVGLCAAKEPISYEIGRKTFNLRDCPVLVKLFDFGLATSTEHVSEYIKEDEQYELDSGGDLLSPRFGSLVIAGVTTKPNQYFDAFHFLIHVSHYMEVSPHIPIPHKDAFTKFFSSSFPPEIISLDHNVYITKYWNLHPQVAEDLVTKKVKPLKTIPQMLASSYFRDILDRHGKAASPVAASPIVTPTAALPRPRTFYEAPEKIGVSTIDKHLKDMYKLSQKKLKKSNNEKLCGMQVYKAKEIWRNSIQEFKRKGYTIPFDIVVKLAKKWRVDISKDYSGVSRKLGNLIERWRKRGIERYEHADIETDQSAFETDESDADES